MFENLFKQVLIKSVVTATANDGFSIRLPNGDVGYLSITDSKGKIVDTGDAVAKILWNVAWSCFINFWKGEGYLKVTTKGGDATQT
jgi:hypothetical protein